MELINKYRNAAYNGNFDLEFKWLNLREENFYPIFRKIMLFCKE